MNRKPGFTLIEIMIVVVIIGVMAAIMIPRLSGSKDQSVFSEAVNALNTLHAAQLRYALEKSDGSYTTDCSVLDVAVTPVNFDTLTCTAGGAVSLKVKAAAQPASGTYTVSVDSAGQFTCAACPARLKRICPNGCV